MTSLEKTEINRLPQRYRPLGAWGYFWYSLLFVLPVIGWIAVIVCAAGAKNVNLRSYARSIILAFVISVVLVAALVVFVLFNPTLMEELMQYLPATK